MTRQPELHPTKDQLREMTALQLTVYIADLRKELEWRRGGPVHKVRTKQLEVALKVRELRLANESAGDV
jgi:HD superfamily phosphohydrolase YqeK